MGRGMVLLVSVAESSYLVSNHLVTSYSERQARNKNHRLQRCVKITRVVGGTNKPLVLLDFPDFDFTFFLQELSLIL